MDSEGRGVILRNKEFLSSNTTNIMHLSMILVSKGIISISDRNLMLKSHSTASELYILLIRKWTPRVFINLIDSLRGSGNYCIAVRLQWEYKVAQNTPVCQSNSSIFHPNAATVGKWFPVPRKKLITCLVQRKTKNNKLILNELKKVLNDNTNGNKVLPHKAAVIGMGGIGKTTMAVLFAHTYGKDYSFIIWIDCGEESITNSFKLIAEELKIRVNNYMGQPRSIEMIAFEVYENIMFSDRACLFIFDNVTELEEIEQLLPPKENSHHHCLITSRHQHWGTENQYGRIKAFLLDVFSEKESNRFLIDALRGSCTRDIKNAALRKKLAEELGHLPLALQIAAVNIARLKWPISKYLEQMRQNPTKFLFTEKIDTYQKPLKMSLEKTINVLNKGYGKLVKKILKILAFVQSDFIEKGMVIAAVGNGMDCNIDKELQRLEDNSLITSSENGKFYSIHRLLQDVIRMRLTNDIVKIRLKRLLRCMWSIYSKNKNSFTRHIWRIWEHAVADNDLVAKYSTFFVSLVNGQSEENRRNSSVEFLKHTLINLSSVIGVEEHCHHSAKWKTRYSLAHVLYQQGKHKESLQFWEGCFSVINRESTSSIIPEDQKSSQLVVKYNLGIVKEKLGRLKDAITLYSLLVETERATDICDDSNITVELGSTFEESNIVCTLMELNDNFPRGEQILCKIIAIFVQLNELETAFANLQQIMELERDEMWCDMNIHYVSIAALKLLQAITSNRSAKLRGGYEYHLRLFKFTYEVLGRWGNNGSWVKLLYWKVIACAADCVAEELIENQQYPDVVAVYQMVHDVQKRVICIEIESCQDFNFPALQAASSLKQFTRNHEAEQVEDLVSRIHKFNTANNGYILDFTFCATKEIYLRGVSQNCLFKFSNVEASQINYDIITKLYFQYVEVHKLDLISTLKECSNLEILDLDKVNMIGGCKARAFLPKLKVFCIDLLEIRWYEMTVQYGTNFMLKSYSFFYKSNNDPNWEIEKIDSLQLDLYQVAVNGIIIVESEQDVKCKRLKEIIN